MWDVSSKSLSYGSCSWNDIVRVQTHAFKLQDQILQTERKGWLEFGQIISSQSQIGKLCSSGLNFGYNCDKGRLLLLLV